MSHITKQNKDLTAIDNGNNIVISFRGTKILAMRKSDNQILIQAGINADQSI